MAEQQVRSEVPAKIVAGDLPEVVVAGLRRRLVRRPRDVPLDRSCRDREQQVIGADVPSLNVLLDVVHDVVQDEHCTGAGLGLSIRRILCLDGLFEALREHVGAESPSYHYCYIDQLDVSMHEVGPNDREVMGMIQEIFDGIDAFLREVAENVPRPAKVLLLSVHGQVPTSTMPVDQYFEPLPLDLVDGSGHRQLTGTQRSNFLRVRMEVERAGRMIHDRTDATVFTRKEWSEAGLFGPDVAASGFDERVGDVLVLPEVNAAVWSPEMRGFDFKGNHGGLSEGEMLAPLVVHDLS